MNVKDIAPRDLPLRISRVPRTEAERRKLRDTVHKLCRRIRPAGRRRQVEEETYNAIIADAQSLVRDVTPEQRVITTDGVKHEDHRLIVPPQQGTVKSVPTPTPQGWREGKSGLVVPA